MNAFIYFFFSIAHAALSMIFSAAYDYSHVFIVSFMTVLTMGFYFSWFLIESIFNSCFFSISSKASSASNFLGCRMNPRVFFSKFMIMFAAIRSLPVSINILSSLKILLESYWIKMIRICAPSISAKMIKNETIWNWSFDHLKNNPMASMSLCFSINKARVLSVAFAIQRTSPLPTSIRFNNSLPKSIYILLFHKSNIHEVHLKVNVGACL